MKKIIIALGLLVSMLGFNTKKCEAKLYVQINKHAPSKEGWDKIIRIFSSNSSNPMVTSKNSITREARLNINEASDLLFLYVTPKVQNELSINKLVKVNKMIISKEIAKFNTGVNSEIIIPEQLAKVEEDSKTQLKIAIKYSHPDKH
ncbi:MAG: hypothetical protein WCI23_04690 [Chlorobiaceae bacterium]|jgi:hypothetical protein